MVSSEQDKFRDSLSYFPKSLIMQDNADSFAICLRGHLPVDAGPSSQKRQYLLLFYPTNILSMGHTSSSMDMHLALGPPWRDPDQSLQSSGRRTKLQAHLRLALEYPHLR